MFLKSAETNLTRSQGTLGMQPPFHTQPARDTSLGEQGTHKVPSSRKACATRGEEAMRQFIRPLKFMHRQ
eukprot:1157669-Pelagomonas_calceolata.AAC.3